MGARRVTQTRSCCPRPCPQSRCSVSLVGLLGLLRSWVGQMVAEGGFETHQNSGEMEEEEDLHRCSTISRLVNQVVTWRKRRTIVSLRCSVLEIELGWEGS